MPTYQVIFTDKLHVEADSEDEAYEKAVEWAAEYRLDEANTIQVIEL